MTRTEIRALCAAALAVGLAAACARAPEKTSDDDDDVSIGGSGSGLTASIGGAGVGGATTTTGAGGGGPASSSATSASSVAASSSASTGGGSSGGVCYSGLGACNPMTVSCLSGEACDIDANTSQFVCFPPPNTAGPLAACDNSLGPFCQHGLSCDTGVCRPYCCTNGDCASGTCTLLGTVGLIDVSVCK